MGCLRGIFGVFDGDFESVRGIWGCLRGILGVFEGDFDVFYSYFTVFEGDFGGV